MNEAGARRRVPVQGRSSETVETVLEATGKLLERMPIDQITTSRIADEAGLSVGALYRFFADKQEIFDAIALRGLAAFQVEMEGVLQPRKVLFGRKHPLDAVLDAYVDFLERNGAFRMLALGRHISDSTRAEQVQPDLGPASVLKDYLIKRMGLKPGAKLNLRLRIAAEVGDRLISYAFAQHDKAGRDAVITELKRLLRGYVSG